MTVCGFPNSHCLSSDLGKLLSTIHNVQAVDTGKLQGETRLCYTLSPDSRDREQGPGTGATFSPTEEQEPVGTRSCLSYRSNQSILFLWRGGTKGEDREAGGRNSHKHKKNGIGYLPPPPTLCITLRESWRPICLSLRKVALR